MYWLKKFSPDRIKFTLVLSNFAKFHFSALHQLNEEHQYTANTTFSESSQEKQPRIQ